MHLDRRRQRGAWLGVGKSNTVAPNGAPSAALRL
jgi:hypothetical protein